MGLFDQFPYSNLHDLNLDWVIAKLKDVDKAQMTAQQAADLLDQVSDKADEAKLYAENAHDDADLANTCYGLARDASDAAEGYRDQALGYKNDAKSSADAAYLDADAAHQDANDAHNDALAAAGSAASAHDDAADAHSDALAAAGSAAAALADANRAQAYGASTGVASLAGTITAQSGDDVSLNDGTYVIIYFGTDAQSSRGMNMFTLHGSTLVTRNLIQSGANVIMSTNGANVLHIVNFMGDGDMKYLILGYMEP